MTCWSLSFVAILLLVKEYVAQNTLGYEPKDRIFVDGAGYKWTMVQKQGFPSDGVLTGFNVYAKVSSQPSTAIYFGIYRPVANTTCTFTLLKLWQPIITDLNKVTQITLSESDQFAFRAGDTIGYSWNNGGIIPCDTGTDFNYCEDSILTETGKDVTLVGNRNGNRVYSFQAVYKRVLGFSPIQRKVTDTPQVWTFIQKQGFSTNGTIKGFNVFTQFTTAARSFNLGLYRPVDGKTCTFTLLKLWTPTVSVANNVTEIAFSAADQFAFKAGDTIGYTWTNYGGIPWDFNEKFSYCEDNTQVTTVGQQIALYDGRFGNRRYSFEAVI